MNLTGFAFRKAIAAVITIFAILFVNFVIFRIAPGDPVRMMFKDPRVSAARLEMERQKFGIDKPLSSQFVAYLKQLSLGELGISFWQKRPVVEVIAEQIPATLALVITALIIAVIFGVALGALAGWRNGTKLDTFSLTASLTLYSIPTFALGIILLLVFAYFLSVFPLGGIATPASGYEGFEYIKDVAWHMFLPCFSIILWYIGEYVLSFRGHFFQAYSRKKFGA